MFPTGTHSILDVHIEWVVTTYQDASAHVRCSIGVKEVHQGSVLLPLPLAIIFDATTAARPEFCVKTLSMWNFALKQTIR